MERNKPWQCSCKTSAERLYALRTQDQLSDIIVTTPVSKKCYKAHSLVLSMCSSVFENLIKKEMGSLAMVGSSSSTQEISLELPEEPQMVELLLSICYGYEDTAFLESSDDLKILRQMYKIRHGERKYKEISFSHQGKNYKYRSEFCNKSANDADSPGKFEELPEEENTTSPWQSQLTTSKERLNALYSHGHLTDLTIIFPGREETYKVHRLVLSMCSPVFEHMLYGPMSSCVDTLDLPFDNPQVIHIIINHCYETNLAPQDIPLDLELALEVYQTADKFLLDHLMYIYAKYIEDFMDENNFTWVWDFAIHFGYSDLVEKCLNVIQHGNPIASSKILFELNEGDITMLMERGLKVDKLLLQPVWRQPEVYGPTDELVLGMQGCGISEYRGMVSDLSMLPRTLTELSLAIGTDQQAIDLQPSMKKMEYMLPCLEYFCIHVVPGVSPKYLSSLPFIDCWGFNQVFLQLSTLDHSKVSWACEIARQLQGTHHLCDWKYRTLTFPSSDLTSAACEALLRGLAQHGVRVEGYINVSSIHYTKQEEERLKELAFSLLSCKFDWYKDDGQFATWVHW
ncbi:unnamed protein product [Meganyctiphanes norvegica]|uniref:BTB domain-containing protein n=1 Tax=Meganyctiphanes norvegica TaxID=48144 RepID=A0AAV2RGC8_MEGNR